MLQLGSGRIEEEHLWGVSGLGQRGRNLQFYFTNSSGTLRDPAVGAYETPLDWVFTQDGHIFNYMPARRPDLPRRDYDPAEVPTLESKVLNERRPYRVFLPRGYDQHGNRRYPVLYVHDGQNIFEIGPFGSWHAARAVEEVTRRGEVREMIVVGVDNTPNRLKDYISPDDGGRADLYARFLLEELMPLVNEKYRTLTGPSHTGTLGSSAGGVAAMYLGWEHSSVFGRVGAMSGSWWLRNFPARVGREARRDLRIYLDSGDSGGSFRDGVSLTLSLRDALIGRYSLGRDLQHIIGHRHRHNEAAWAARLPGALRFLFPLSEEPVPAPLALQARAEASSGLAS
ncbi:MAG: alpha/beta hydrolase-fold protein [Candidatus Eremiobacterota bacterium]